MPSHYSRAQILLHWGIFLAIVVQFLFHETISGVWRQMQQGAEPAFSPLAALHVFLGLAILLLVVWRLALRLTRGAPALPEKEPAPLKLAAHGTHMLLYVLMLALPVTGALAWFGGVTDLAEVHELLFQAMFVLVILHLLGALYQQFVLKTDILSRMKRAG
ncbi:cytochrome b [Pseudodonghicola flavimaris]|uniref:Cytochrome b/b6 domain-containing protein n=1 Tax=Pseudodonghicola flavimaris TaxID=3050036 RepID=A0ABT7EZ53_9RHOB|nr:cytochrome b/b6 domain-containing protein [Pseudodonghicola flavimaris]MDK3017534.1 cytochrome b/b6 domain-containing protein [Pseudodonghicola flavimaris]